MSVGLEWPGLNSEHTRWDLMNNMLNDHFVIFTYTEFALSLQRSPPGNNVQICILQENITLCSCRWTLFFLFLKNEYEF